VHDHVEMCEKDSAYVFSSDPITCKNILFERIDFYERINFSVIFKHNVCEFINVGFLKEVHLLFHSQIQF
jgi:hypothetical protein